MVSIKQIEDRAETQVSFSNQTSLALFDTLKSTGSRDKILSGLFYRLRACGSRSNHWTGDNLHNKETGDLYPANGVLWACGSRLCASCAKKAVNRNKGKLRLAVENQKLLAGESYKFITLTIPNPNLSLLQTRAILNEAWVLFRKRKYFKENIRGVAKGEEFTVTTNGYHYHYHLLCITKFLSFEHFRAEWTECVSIAFNKFNVPFAVNNKDELLNVFIKKISSSKNDLKEAIQKVCSYLTKSDSWEKMPEKDLIEVASIERFPRMFALLGSFRNQKSVEAAKNSGRENKEMIKNGSTDIIFNKQCLSDGENTQLNGASAKPKRHKLNKRVNWRQHIEKFGLDSYLERLSDDVEFAAECRKGAMRFKYRYASLKTLDGKIL